MGVGRDARSCAASAKSPPRRAEAKARRETEAGSGPPTPRQDGRTARRGGCGPGQIRASERASERASGRAGGGRHRRKRPKQPTRHGIVRNNPRLNDCLCFAYLHPRRSFGFLLITLVPRRLHGAKSACGFRPTTRRHPRLGLAVRCGDLAL